MSENYRDKIISNNISFCLRFKHLLSDWEIEFVNSVDGQDYSLTQKQFNLLQRISADVAKKVAPADR